MKYSPPSLQAWSAVCALAAWACYLPLGAKYVTWVLCVSLAVRQLAAQSSGWGSLAAQPGIKPCLALLAWLALSALWSPASPSRIAAHLWSGALPLLAAMVLAACPPAAARRALEHMVAASAVVGAATAWRSFGPLPGLLPEWLLASTIMAEGNQRIVASLLLAIGGAVGLWLATAAPRQPWHLRLAWGFAAALALAGLVGQDRRTGMLVLPVMMLIWAATVPRGLLARTGLVIATATLALGLVAGVDGVRARFVEGVAELQAYRGDDAVATSWGQRLRMIELSAALVAEQPLRGHGVASWQERWRERVPPGSALSVHSTPHNELLLAAVQGGLPAAVLLLAWWAAQVYAAARAGRTGVPALMLWSAFGVSALFNASLRDAKFALPLLLLGSWTLVLARGGETDTPPRPTSL